MGSQSELKEEEEEMTVREKLAAGKYETKLPYPERKEKDAEEKREAYRVDEGRLCELFKQDALKELGLSKHPRADKIYSYAWAERHANGLHEIFDFLEELAELFKEDGK